MKHKHHIIPRHAGGTDDPSNLVYLTVEEHAEAHKKLYEKYGRWQDYSAWQGLSGRMGKEEIIRYIQREANLGNQHFKGKTHSDKHKKKLSKVMKESRKNIKTMGHFEPHTKEAKELISNNLKGNTNKLGKTGYTLSDEFKEITRQRMKKDNPAKRPDVREKLRQAALRRYAKKQA